MSDTAKFETYVKQIYEKLTVQKIDYFALLGLTRTATHKEIEINYRKYAQYFSKERVNTLTDAETKKMGNFIIEKIERAHEILTNYDKKAEYERRGFREFSADLDIPEEEPEEKAKNLYKKAKTLHSQQQFQKAVQTMEEAIKLDAKVPTYYLFLGVCQAQVPYLKVEAEKTMLKAAAMETWNAEPYVALGMMFYSDKYYPRAEFYFRKALDLEDNHPVARKKLTEIVGPEGTILTKVTDVLRKGMPTFFDRKKKGK